MRDAVPKSVTLVTAGAMYPPAMLFDGESVMLPVVEPPTVKLLKAVVWIELAPALNVSEPDTDA